MPVLATYFSIKNQLNKDEFKCQTNLSKGLKNAPEHVLSYVEVQRAHIEPHGPCATSLEHAGHGCCPVLLSLN